MQDIAIDAHHHFWDPARGHFPWMEGEAMAPIRRAFAPEHLAPLLRDAGIARSILVQAQSSEDETRAFLALAARTGFVAGVVGWIDLTSPDAHAAIARLKAAPGGGHLVGIRHQVHDEPDPRWLLRDDVRRGLAAVEAHGLAYDLLLRPREIPAAIETVAAFPGLRFVVDHAAKPMIRRGILAPWAEAMRGFAAHRGHAWCKLSGLVTEADWQAWRAGDLRPFVATALEIFGAGRCMFGSDWPVCTLAAGYDEVIGALRECLATLGDGERARILGRNAIEAYRLDHTPGWPRGVPGSRA